MNSFEKRHKRFRVVFILTLILSIITIVAGIVTTFIVVNNPEVIGEFFGKIVHGFNLTK